MAPQREPECAIYLAFKADLNTAILTIRQVSSTLLFTFIDV
jgi:hypothetical protein